MMLSVSHYSFAPIVDSYCEFKRLSVPIVLLHGWGCDSQIWQPLLPFFRQWSDVVTIDLVYKNKTVDSLCDDIIDQLPSRFILCGWSLGGMLATRLAARYSQKVDGLITLASNASFVANDHWSNGMPVATYEGFYTLFKKSVRQGLKRFSLLQTHGDAEGKQQMQWLQSLSHKPDDEDLLSGLEMLSSIDNADHISGIACPALYLFGEKDSLVSVYSANAIEQLISDSNLQNNKMRQKVVVLDGCGHLLPYSVDNTKPLLDDFLSLLLTSKTSTGHP